MFVCMYVYIPLTCLVATQATRGFQMLWNWVIDSRKPLYGCWGLNLGLLYKHQVLLTAEFPYSFRIKFTNIETFLKWK